MQSISFDRAADFYDATRGHPLIVSQAIAASIQELFPEPKKVLEIGIGTGRIAIPCAQLGVRNFGVDLSSKMLARLQQNKSTGLRFPQISRADAAALPFPARSFSAVLAVHVFHLIADWRTALGEIQRVLSPEGVLLTGFDWRSDDSPAGQMRDRWQELTDAFIITETRVGAPFGAVKTFLEDQGAQMDEWTVIEWERTFVPRTYLQSLRDGIYSSSWRVPDQEREEFISQLQSWAETHLGDLDREYPEVRKFIWQRFRWV